MADEDPNVDDELLEAMRAAKKVTAANEKKYGKVDFGKIVLGALNRGVTAPMMGKEGGKEGGKEEKEEE